MKANIHPAIFTDTKVICVCGNTFVTSSTRQIINVEVCNKCHPFFTGEQRFVDTKGKVEKFQKRQQVAKEMSAKLKSGKKRNDTKEERKVKSLRELLSES